MASFAVSAVDAGSAAAAAAAPGAGALNFTTLTTGGNAHAIVSPKMLTGVAATGTAVSVAALLIPIMTFIIPVCKGRQGLSQRTMLRILFVLFGGVAWALFALPSLPDSKLVMIVNCLAAGIQSAYAMFFIYKAAGKKRKVAMLLCFVVAVLSAIMILMVVFLIVRNHKWSTKVIGIIASAFSTLTFLAGLVEIWILFHTQESAMNTLQLVANLGSATIWGSYGFLFHPVNVYIVVPNLTGVGTTLVQLICLAIHTLQKRRAAAGNRVHAGAAGSA